MDKASKTHFRALTIAGSDSGGGAGIQADLKTFSALECYGMSVITALTAQNTCGVTGIYPIPPEFAVQQIDAVLSDIGADAVKIGMLYSAALIEAVADALQRHRVKRIVLDPVMVAQSGDRLVQEDAVEAIRRCLIPLAEVVTPNLPEAEVLTGRSLSGRAEMELAARALGDLGGRHILIKDGHGEGMRSDDLLYIRDEDRFVVLGGERIVTRNNHGTGCTLSSAIAAWLARGEDTLSAVRKGRDYIQEAIRRGAAYQIGNGAGPVHHFWQQWFVVH